MIKQFNRRRALLASLISLAALAGAPHAFAAGDTADQRGTPPKNVMDDPSYIAYQRYNGFIVDESKLRKGATERHQ